MQPHTPEDPFRRRPDLAPRFIPDSTGQLPFLGFRFLDGVVLLDEAVHDIPERRIRVLTRMILGQTTNVITERIKDATHDEIIWDERAIYEKFGLGFSLKNRAKRPMLFPKCLAFDIMHIEKFGPRSKFPINSTWRPTIVDLAHGYYNEYIALRQQKKTKAINNQLLRIGNRVGFGRRELLVLGAMITNQLTLDDLIPKTGLFDADSQRQLKP